MNKTESLRFSPSVFGYPLLFVMALWLVFWAESRFGWNFNSFGIYPRKFEGLRGIFLGPFIHGDLKHLFNNSVPLFVLGTALFYFYRNIRWKIVFYGLLITGFATWLIGRPANHIGASGVVYMLASFHFFKGIFSKQYQLTALSFVVVFLYGSLLWYVFPVDPKISWEGHLSGFFVGFAFSFIFKGNFIKEKKYEWEREGYRPEEDEFMKQFDEDGNFIETPKVINPNSGLDDVDDTPTPPRTVRVIYTVKKNTEARDNL
ncbi:rhomboid family intramembrane serine protease [Aequorivita echinoideorum]|uniref:Rhomboid family intramembrane serine protease n=1 Tax=Aequorivita echinoideorum TaxID=1549647 RepID=A0ABS5S062_9FLAO|nr:rhomboid family intramembrane serine protease [Aequorivita echinoideorum]MBT0606606.1 rhomboid family intramembrane serine protease [Aequorivita echinoideorum]